jgi:hypothetical protein
MRFKLRFLLFLLLGFAALAQPVIPPRPLDTNSAANKISIVNGTGVATTFNQQNASNFPVTIKSDYYATNHSYVIGNGYTAGGTGGSYPIAHFRPTTYGDSMPFDLMPNGTNADVWMDLCADDITPSGLGGNGGSTLSFLDIRHRSIANGGYAQIATDAWGSRTAADLRLQVNGGSLLLGPFSGAMNQFLLWGKTNIISVDHTGPRNRFFQARPATDVNFGVDTTGGRVLIDAINDSSTRIPINYSASSHNFTTDGSSTFGLQFSNNVVTTVTHTNTGNMVVGGTATVAGNAAVGSLTLGGNVTASTGLVKVVTNLMVTADGFGTAYSTLPMHFRPATNVNLTWDAPSAGVLRETTFNDAAATIPRRYQSSSHNFTTDDGATYLLILSNNVVTFGVLQVSGASTLTGKTTVGAVVPSNRSSISTFENLMGNGANGSANFQEFGGSAGIYVLAAGGTAASPTATTTSQITRIAGLGIESAGSTNWFIQATVDLTPTGTWSASDHGMTAGFSATPAGTLTRIVNVIDTGTAMAVGSTTATSPAASAVLDLQSTTTGLLPPRMTTTQKNAISSPAEGLLIYDTTLHKLCIRVAAAWETVTSL